MSSVRQWPRHQRQALLQGPTATVELDNGEGNPRTVIALPRAAFLAFSTVAASLLQDPSYTNILLLPGMAAPAALRYVVEWIPRACDSTDFMPIKRKEDFRQNVRIYQAALSLGITEALTTIGGWLNLCISSFETHAWSWDHTKDVLLTLPKDCAMVVRLIEKVALTRRRGLLDPAFAVQLAAMLNAFPELAQRFHAEDAPAMLKQRSGSDGALSAGSSDKSSGFAGNGSPRRKRGGRKQRRGGGEGGSTSPEPSEISTDRVLSDADVDVIMGRGR